MRGCFLGIRSVLDSMREAGGGSVVNISSNAGMLGTPNALAYVTSKWAVRGMTKAAAAELGTYGIRVNSIHPGAVATPLLMGDGFTEEAFVQRGRDRLAVPRIAEPDEISPAVIYFASDLSGYASRQRAPRRRRLGHRLRRGPRSRLAPQPRVGSPGVTSPQESDQRDCCGHRDSLRPAHA